METVEGEATTNGLTARPLRFSRLLAWSAAAVVVWLLEVIVWRFSRSRGAGLSGDEPHYLVLAEMLAHGSLHPLAFYQRDAVAHAYYSWPRDLLASSANLHAYRGPHGLVTIHGLGLPALLAPFVGLFGGSGGVVGLMALEAVGWVYVFFRAVELAGLRWPGRVVTALAMAGPAVWIASTQLYPDFVAGTLIAVAIVDLATLEAARRLDARGVIGIGVSLGLLPWLHVKNLVPAGIVLVAVIVVARRVGSWRRPGIAVAVALVSWLALLTYNLWGFGHALGVPQPGPVPSWPALTHGLGLLLDRQQGLIIQVPTVILGVAGLWMARQVVPWAVAATALAVAALLYLNATYVGVPYGGTAVAGRFSWSVMAPLLLWVPFLLLRLRTLRSLWTLGTVIIVGWLFQTIPVLSDQHAYYNAQISGPPWDPSRYPGWWGPVNKLLPELTPGGPLWGTPRFGVLIVLVIVATIGASALLATRRPPLRREILAGGVGLCVALVAVLALVVRPDLPSKPVVFSGRDVGSPLITGSSPVTGATVPLQAIDSGTYTITVRYTLTGSASITGFCTSGTPARPGRPRSTITATLAGPNDQATLKLRCGAGLIWFQSAAQPNSRLRIVTVSLRKTAR